ncbi:MAG: putative rane protein [Clostridiales bacterium]|jgi:stage II sporulation protein D|nr:putative rane protein [Clostridiales bacterium]
MKKGIAIIFMILIIVVAIILPSIIENEREVQSDTNTETNISLATTSTTEDDTQIKEYEWEYKLDDTELLTRGLLAKMVALISNSKSQIYQNYDREIEYADTDSESWYDKYINVVAIENIFKPESENFEPFKTVSYEEAINVALKYGINKEKLPQEITSAKAGDAISVKDWFEIYETVVELEDVDNDIRVTDMVIIGTPANIAGLNAWELVSDKGKFVFEGLSVDRLIDKRIRVLIRDEEIIAVLDMIDNNPLITNAWIEEVKEKEVRIFMSGEYRTFETNNIIEARNGVVGDIKLFDGKVDNVIFKTEIIDGKVLKVTNKSIEIEGKGVLEFTPDYKIYKVNDKVESKTVSNLIVGYVVGEFVIDNGKICAAIINKDIIIDRIRVLISNNTMGQYAHDVVRVTSDVNYTVQIGDKIQVYKPGDVYEVIKEELEIGRTIISTNSTGKIKLLTISRGSINPSYRGYLEVTLTPEGINVVNVVNFEEYLYAVIPGEMSTSVDLEALKVQAVCARSFAYARFYANSFCTYGAHVDDSVASQVYNTAPEDDKSIKAVKDTAGVMLRSNGNVISANFFSTSCGVTANSGEVWTSANRDFPTYTPDYLKSRTQNEAAQELDLSDELVFSEFIKNNAYDSYDLEYAWNRWSVNLNLAQITASVNANLSNRYKIVPKLIKTLGEDGKYRSREISTVGDVKDVKVYSRGKSGVLTEIIIIGTEATIKVGTEYNIRLLLAPKNTLSGGADIELKRKDGSVQKNMTMLPSAFFIMQKVYSGDTLESINFIGGGYGHGVGMSQNGVKTMITLGKTYIEVLQHYYKGVEVR